MSKLLVFLTLLFTVHTWPYDWQEPDWSSQARITPGTNRANIYSLPVDQWDKAIEKGTVHALKWPVEITGLLIPYEPLKFFLEEKKNNPLRRFIEKLAKAQLGYDSLDGMYQWMGLNEYPEEYISGVFRIPYPEQDGKKPDYRMGVSLLDTPAGKAVTFSCATCHSGTFLGKSIMGLNNKRSRANEFFWMAKKYIPYVPAKMFQNTTKSSDEQRRQFAQTQKNLKYIDTKRPQVLGLDTASAHVALSLARRAPDAYASMDPKYAKRPRPDLLKHFVADSKIMPWWNLKYKTRWLADGSIISGNPILMNILWNELGRGTDLKQLDKWVDRNDQTVKELTAAVFANKAPHWLDFFPEKTIDLALAKRGEKVFNKSCMKCHGRYAKAWSAKNADQLKFNQLVRTSNVFYHPTTLVKNVNTDPNRYLGTKDLAVSLNSFAISKKMGLEMKRVEGYVPPPMEGIFLRYPYMHNNSIPNLCALMEHPSRRPRRWVQGPSLKESDYDQACLGYPIGNKIPRSWWKERDAIYEVSRSGLKNTGHDQMFWNKDGSPKISNIDKKALLEFMKTL